MRDKIASGLLLLGLIFCGLLAPPLLLLRFVSAALAMLFIGIGVAVCGVIAFLVELLQSGNRE